MNLIDSLRIQARAMLSRTAMAPPQWDEFMMPGKGHSREADRAALGWREAEGSAPR